MSSLQKFHRRTMSLGPVTWPPTAIGGGDVANGYWLGGPAFNALVVAPKSTEASLAWGTQGTLRGTTSTTNGLANTNTLAGFGQTAHPAAYAAKNLTTGGYNTWYLPAKNELNTLYANKSATPFATANSFVGANHWSSTEDIGGGAWLQDLSGGGQYTYGPNFKANSFYVRATRRYALPTATIGSGDSTVGYWLGTAGDGVSKMVVAPKSTEVQLAWGSYGTTRSTVSTTNGLANTNTLYAFGSAAHPAAYYTKTLTTGGYNTWYMPAKDELVTMYSNKSATPYAVADGARDYFLSSTEDTGGYAWGKDLSTGGTTSLFKSSSAYNVRAVRRV